MGNDNSGSHTYAGNNNTTDTSNHIPNYGAMDNKYIRNIEKTLSALVKEECWFEVGSKGRLSTRHLQGQDMTIRLLCDSLIHDSIASMRLVEMPGCCGILISTGAYVYTRFRRMSINTILNKFRVNIARFMGYSVILCTDISTNIAEKKTLNKNEWNDILHFTNKRTKNPVDISVITLNASKENKKK